MTEYQYGSFKTKLEYVEGENYFYLGDNKSKKYVDEKLNDGSTITLSEDDIRKCFEYAYRMAIENKQRENRSGGKHQRRELEIFWDDFRGKIAECFAKDYFERKGCKVDDIDFEIYDRGKWDKYDLRVNNHIVAIKSSKHFSQLLLLESKDWNSSGSYVGNQGENKYLPEWFLFVRTKIEHPRARGGATLTTKEEMWNIVNEINITAELTGGLSFYDFVNQVIRYEYIIRQGSKFKVSRTSRGTEMDADNYYVKLSELESVEAMLEKLL